MQNKITTLFVYGTLRSIFSGPPYKYLSDYFSYLGQAKVQGVLYAGEHPAAMMTDEEKFVTGELYEIKNGEDFSKAIRLIDEYEGVEDQREISLYRRELTCAIYNDTKITAWIYWYNRNIVDEALIPSGDISDFIEIDCKYLQDDGTCR